jgi:hypothetical protein
MKTLFVAWKQKDPGGWHPVGRLDADVKKGVYSFRYIKGALEAQSQGFSPFDSFPELHKEFISSELFPFFLNRVQNSSRPSFRDYLERMDLAPETGNAYDPIDLLAVSEGRRQTDNLEIFPKIERIEGEPFRIKFFLHGLRFLTEASLVQTLVLTPGENLCILLEPNNPATPWAIQFQTESRIVIGYAPRYLLPDLLKLVTECIVSAIVARVNPPPTPPNQRVLVQFEGCWPEGYEPMSDEQFQPLVESRAIFDVPELSDLRV